MQNLCELDMSGVVSGYIQDDRMDTVTGRGNKRGRKPKVRVNKIMCLGVRGADNRSRKEDDHSNSTAVIGLSTKRSWASLKEFSSR